jgi:hypothetical protein
MDILSSFLSYLTFLLLSIYLTCIFSHVIRSFDDSLFFFGLFGQYLRLFRSPSRGTRQMIDWTSCSIQCYLAAHKIPLLFRPPQRYAR